MNAEMLRERAAEAWRQAALVEHASIASFSRAALELLAVGAPLALVARTHEAALDEIRHTELSFAIARELDGVDASAGPLQALPAREATLARVAVDTLLEAALPELVAAREAIVAAERCAAPATRDALRAIGADEARHAELAWDVVAWCIAEDGRAPRPGRVREAVRAAVPEAPLFASAGRVSALEELGVLEEGTRRAVAYEVWRGAVVERLERL